MVERRRPAGEEGHQRQSNRCHSRIVQSPVISSTTRLPDRIPNFHEYVVSNLGRYPYSHRNLYQPQPQPQPQPSLLRQRLMEGRPVKTELSTFKALSAVAVIFLCSILILALLYSKFPDLAEDERRHIKIPLDIEEAKQLGLVLDRYKEKYLYEVMSGVFLVYIFLQSFAIPGSMFLSILSGFLFPFMAALILVCTCSAIGASLCFLLSHLLGKKLVKKYCPQKAAEWALAIEKNKGNLLYYMIFLRVTPFLPNWFINLTAPIIGVPLVPFALGTFIGVAPPSFVAIQAGQTLHTLTSSSDAWSWTSIIVLSLCAGLSLIPVIMKNKLKAKFE